MLQAAQAFFLLTFEFSFVAGKFHSRGILYPEMEESFVPFSQVSRTVKFCSESSFSAVSFESGRGFSTGIWLFCKSNPEDFSRYHVVGSAFSKPSILYLSVTSSFS